MELEFGRQRGSSTRLAVWVFHLALPVFGLWLLISQPRVDIMWQHHPAHFWLVLAVAWINVVLAVVISEAARRRTDARLFVVSMAFVAAAGFLGLHAAATPGIVLDARNNGFDFATPVGLTLAALFVALSSVDVAADRSAAVLGWLSWLRAGLLALMVAWGVVSLAGLPPLREAVPPEQAHRVIILLAMVAILLYAIALLRYYALYRRRRAAVLLSLMTACVLLAEAMVAIVLSRNWHLSWWEWHFLMTAGFGYVAYSAYTQYRNEGSSAGLFDALGTEDTVHRVRAEYGAALEALVDAFQRQEQGALRPDEMALITVGLARRFELSEGQTAVLGRAAAALAGEREQVRRLDALVAVGHHSQVLQAESDLLRGVVAQVSAGFDRHAVRIGLVTDGQLNFPADLVAGADLPDDDRLRRAADASLASLVPVAAEPGVLVFPLTVKGHPAGVLAVRHARNVLGERDRALLSSLAIQVSIGLENVRLYRQLDVLFRQYMSADVATTLIADPSQAALGGALREVTVLFADLRGYTAFAERSTPPEIVAMLNRYFEVATAAILAEGGTIVQYIGDALMAIFNAPSRQPDHAARAARAALAMQSGVEAIAASTPDWPRFRVGVNTGETLVGNIGSEALRNYNATGDAVNVAARLQAVAEPGQVVIGQATYEQIGGSAEVTPLGEFTVKGRRQPVTAYVLHGWAPVGLSE
jgi:class 3 adenylate cyclase